MTGGGSGSSSDLIASVICKQYQADLYALAMAGNVILFGLIALVVLPLTWWLNRREVDL
jgi:raffinose/stachyose/melibiose transport system permease protein